MFGSLLVDPLRAAIFAAAHLLGSLGAGIFGVSFLLRLALLPITLRVARRAASQQRLLASLKPELDALRARHKQDAVVLWRETQALFARRGYRQFDLPVLLGNFARVPFFGGLYGALKNVNLPLPGLALAAVVSAMSGMSVFIGSHATSAAGRNTAMALVAAGIGFFFLSHLSSGLILSWGASSVVDVVQSAIIARERRK